MRVTFLGTGTSHGIPSIGCQCAVCCSPDPRDVRTRCAVALQCGDRTLVIDTPPEFRQQAIRSHVGRIDALLITHAHADHIFGLDDVRRYNDMQRDALPVHAAPRSLQDLARIFHYVFAPEQIGGGVPRLAVAPIEGERFDAAGIEIEAIPVLHGRLPVTGFRVGRFAYVTDVSEIPPASRRRLRGLHTLVLGALRPEPHPTHFTLAQALAVLDDLAPERAYFVHMTHQVPHGATEATFPPGVRLAYDGLILTVPD